MSIFVDENEAVLFQASELGRTDVLQVDRLLFLFI